MKRPVPRRTQAQELQLYRSAVGALVLRLGGEVTLTSDELSATDALVDRRVIGGHEFRAWIGVMGEG